MSDPYESAETTDSAVVTGTCGNNCEDALDRLWEYLDAELGAPDAETVRAAGFTYEGIGRG